MLKRGSALTWQPSRSGAAVKTQVVVCVCVCVYVSVYVCVLRARNIYEHKYFYGNHPDRPCCNGNFFTHTLTNKDTSTHMHAHMHTGHTHRHKHAHTHPVDSNRIRFPFLSKLESQMKSYLLDIHSSQAMEVKHTISDRTNKQEFLLYD